MRLLKRKKKEKKWVHLEMEKDGEIQNISMRVGKKIGMLKIAKKLGSMGKQGWQLLNITGDPETVGMFNAVLAGYQTGDPIPIKRMVKAAGLSATPTFIKKLLKKDEKGR